MQNDQKQSFKRFLSLFLACLILFGMLAGCRKAEAPEKQGALELGLPGFFGGKTENSQETEVIEIPETTEATKELSVTDLLKAVLTIKDDLKTALEDLKNNDIDQAKDKIQGLPGKTAVIRESMEATMNNLGDSMPSLQEQLKNIQALLDLVDLAKESLLDPAIVQVEAYPFTAIRSDDSINMQLIGHYLDFVELLMPDVEKLVAEANSVDFSLVDDDGEIAEYLITANELLKAYKENPAVFSAMKSIFGVNGDRTYLVAAQNSAEIRASGGFPGAMGVIRIKDGSLILEDFKGVNKVIAAYAGTEAKVTAQENYLFHGGMSTPRDADFCPDFERVGHIWALGYKNLNNEEVDGVISLTPAIVQKLLAAMDEEIKLFDGLILNGDNAVRTLQHDLYFKYYGTQYIEARETVTSQLFADTAKKTLQLLMENLEIGDLTEYLSIAKECIDDRTLMLWMDDEAEQSVIQMLGWNGGLNKDPEKPQAGVYYNCTVASKMGWFLEMDTQMGERVKNEDGSYTYPITVTLSNIITDEEYNSASYYITSGSRAIGGSTYFFAPAGGTVSDFSASNQVNIRMDTYHDLQLGYMQIYQIYPGKPVTVTYNVTTAPGVEIPLEFSKTPTVQEYH